MLVLTILDFSDRGFADDKERSLSLFECEIEYDFYWILLKSGIAEATKPKDDDDYSRDEEFMNCLDSELEDLSYRRYKGLMAIALILRIDSNFLKKPNVIPLINSFKIRILL